MATYTDNYNLTKPTFAESADIRTINGNMDTIDAVLHASQVSLADAYDETRTSSNPYNTGDIVMYELLMYKCLEDGVYGTWDGTKWERTTAGENGAGGTEVEANPSGTPSADLAKLGINGIIYSIPSGDEVEANPSGTGDTDLTKLGINGTVYNIPSGGGGSGVGYSEKTLFEQPYNTAFPSTITLSESFENFDALGFYLTKGDDSNYYDYLPVNIFTKSALTEALNGAISGRTNTLIITGWQLNNSQYARFQVDSTTQLTIPVSGGAWNLKKITGIKFGIGGSGGSGYNATLLYDSESLVNGAPYEQDIALLDNLSNYDMALLILGNPSDLAQANTSGTTTAIIDTSFTLTDSTMPYYDFHWAGYDHRWLLAHFTDTTFNVRDHGGDVNETIYRIYGIKFSGGGTNVEPNPQEEPTDTLSTIRIGDTVFDIAGGSGGGLTKTLLWDYVDDNNGTIPAGSYSVTLNDNINNYDMLVVESVSQLADLSSDWNSTNLWYVDVNALNNNVNNNYVTYTSWNERATKFNIVGTTFAAVKNNGADTNGLIRVYGLKFESGGGSYAETVIYENTGSTQESSMTLTDDIATYDLILFEAYVSDDNRIYTISGIYRASTIISGWNATLLRWSPSNQYINLEYVSSTELTCYASSNMYIKRIVGLKCSGGSGGSSSGDNDDLSEKTWTLITSTTGTSAEIDIPSGTEWLVLTAEMSGIVSEVGKERISNITKLMDVAQLTIWGKGYEWADTLGNHTTISMAVNGGKVSIKSGYNTVTAKVYAVS